MQAAARRSSFVAALPAYNEAQALPALLPALARILPEDGRILVIDDGSADDTAALVDRLAVTLPIHLVRHGRNKGLSEAMRTLFAEADRLAADDGWLVVLDADGTHDPVQIIELIDAAGRANADVAVCSRFAAGGSTVGVPWWRRLTTAASRAVYRFALGPLPANDLSSGFRLYRMSLIRRALATYGPAFITTAGFGVMVEIITRLAWLDARVTEAPIRLRYDLKRSASRMRTLDTAADFARLLWRLRRARAQIPARRDATP
jgi:dolichol-phosphate mannosyltransferase